MVTPCVGVWIETIKEKMAEILKRVTPCVGVWIETLKKELEANKEASHPAWVCGLKLIFA